MLFENPVLHFALIPSCFMKKGLKKKTVTVFYHFRSNHNVKYKNNFDFAKLKKKNQMSDWKIGSINEADWNSAAFSSSHRGPFQTRGAAKTAEPRHDYVNQCFEVVSLLKCLRRDSSCVTKSVSTCVSSPLQPRAFRRRIKKKKKQGGGEEGGEREEGQDSGV